MPLATSGNLTTGAKVIYLHTLVRGESLFQFDSLPADTGGANPLNVETVILGLGSHFFPVNSLPKQKHAISCGMRKPCGFKVRQ